MGKINIKLAQKMSDCFEKIFLEHDNNKAASIFKKSVIDLGDMKMTSLDLGDIRFTKSQSLDTKITKFTMSAITRDSTSWEDDQKIENLLTIRIEKKDE